MGLTPSSRQRLWKLNWDQNHHPQKVRQKCSLNLTAENQKQHCMTHSLHSRTLISRYNPTAFINKELKKYDSEKIIWFQPWHNPEGYEYEMNRKVEVLSREIQTRKITKWIYLKYKINWLAQQRRQFQRSELEESIKLSNLTREKIFRKISRATGTYRRTLKLLEFMSVLF